MTLSDFTKMNRDKQSYTILKFPVLVKERHDNQYFYKLYELYSFYIERRYDIKSGKLLGTMIFESDFEELDLYLTDIDLSKL